MFPNCLLLLVVVTYTIIIILIITKSLVISNKYRQVIVHLVHRDKNDKEITNMETETSAIFVTSKTIITADKKRFQDRIEINFSPSHLTNNPDKIIEETSNSYALQHTDEMVHPSISLLYLTPSVRNLHGDLQLTRSTKDDDTNSQFTIIALSILITIGVICLLVNFFYNGCSKD